MDLGLKGKRAVVTGSTAGIGLAAARALAEEGALVTINGRTVERVEAAVGTLERAVPGARVAGVAADLGRAEGCAALVRQVPEADILVNNVGIQRVSPIVDFDPEDFRLMQRLMVESPFLLIRAVLPGMYRRGWGRVVNVSSAHGLRASAFKSAYVTAKHALEGLSKVTALEGAPYGVTSNCINPSYVRTPLVESQIADQARVHGIPEDEVLEKVLLTENAIKRLIEPEEVASLVGWLVSDNAGMVTGASYTMDGGWTAR